jgi:mitochondrial fission protein ELM1
MNSLSSINVTPAANPDIRCWLLDDARPGHFNQSLALFTALQLNCCPERIRLPEAPRLARGLQSDSQRGLLIGCGRRAAWHSRKIKKQQPTLWTNIQILNPGYSQKGFDWVLVPEHDGVAGHHVISFVGSLSRINEQYLEKAKAEQPEFGTSAQPRLALLIGAPTRRAGWHRRNLKLWLAQLREYLQDHGGSAVILNSSRTPRWATALLSRCAGAGIMFYPHDGASNPYAAALAFADYIWVTGDSVNMLAEACSTNKPVRALGGEKLQGRIRACWQQLLQRGRLAQDWKSPGEGPWEAQREASRIAALLRRRGALLGIEKA